MSSNKTQLYQAKEVAKAYVSYRPHGYSEQLYDTVLNYCRETPQADFALAVDIGCGSGQSTMPLTRHFKKVIGLDISAAQISNAPTDVPNASFRVGTGEDLSFVESGTVNLLTVACALHFMDCQKVYAEANRVLKPGGVFVAYNYPRVPSLDDPKGMDVYKWFDGTVLGPYWNTDAYGLEGDYRRNFSLPFPGWKINDSLTVERMWTVDELVGYMTSLSAYQSFVQQDPGACAQSLDELKRKLNTVYSGGNGNRKILVTWPLVMLMGRKPVDG